MERKELRLVLNLENSNEKLVYDHLKSKKSYPGYLVDLVLKDLKDPMRDLIDNNNMLIAHLIQAIQEHKEVNSASNTVTLELINELKNIKNEPTTIGSKLEDEILIDDLIMDHTVCEIDPSDLEQGI